METVVFDSETCSVIVFKRTSLKTVRVETVPQKCRLFGLYQPYESAVDNLFLTACAKYKVNADFIRKLYQNIKSHFEQRIKEDRKERPIFIIAHHTLENFKCSFLSSGKQTKPIIDTSQRHNNIQCTVLPVSITITP